MTINGRATGIIVAAASTGTGKRRHDRRRVRLHAQQPPRRCKMPMRSPAGHAQLGRGFANGQAVRHEREQLALVSAVDAGVVPLGLPEAGNAPSWAPTVNADGTQIAFVTDATNLLPSRRAKNLFSRMDAERGLSRSR